MESPTTSCELTAVISTTYKQILARRESFKDVSAETKLGLRDLHGTCLSVIKRPKYKMVDAYKSAVKKNAKLYDYRTKKPPAAGPSAQPIFSPIRKMPNASTRSLGEVLSVTHALDAGRKNAPKNVVKK